MHTSQYVDQHRPAKVCLRITWVTAFYFFTCIVNASPGGGRDTLICTLMESESYGRYKHGAEFGKIYTGHSGRGQAN